MWLLCLGLVVLMFEFANNSGTIPIDRRNKTSVECASIKDITFKFCSNRNEEYTCIAIAECYLSSESCLMLTQTLENNKYEVVHTGRGGLLRLTSIDNATIGTYKCCETFNPRNCISKNISPSQSTLTADHSKDDTNHLSVPCSGETCGHIVLGTLQDTTIECSSNVDLTFQFVSNKSNNSERLAECYLTMTSCSILNPLLLKQYSLSSTGSGGVLRINSLDDESIGIYKCLETYDPINFVSFDIDYLMDEAENTTNQVPSVTQNTTENHSGEIGTNNMTSSWGIPTGICASLMSFVVIIGCSLARKRWLAFKNTKEAEQRRDEEITLLDHTRENKQDIEEQQCSKTSDIDIHKQNIDDHSDQSSINVNDLINSIFSGETYKQSCEDTDSSATSELPVWIILNSADPSQCAVLPSIEDIELDSVTCSSSLLGSLFRMLLTLYHEVNCTLISCDITSSVEGSDKQTRTWASLTTGLNNTFYFMNDSPGLWEALHGLNIKSVQARSHVWVNYVELMLQSLSSLSQLETLSISMDLIHKGRNLWEALHGLNIKTLGLRGDMKVNDVELMSQSLSSLTQLETLSITVPRDGLKALHGLNIKSLSLLLVHWSFDDVFKLRQSLSSLIQLETLSISGFEDSPELVLALHGLNIKSLSMCNLWNHCELLSLSLSSLSQLAMLSIEMEKDSLDLWEALHGLHIKSLSLRQLPSWNRNWNHVESLSKSLSSLTQLETLSVSVYKDSPGLWEALHGLNIKSLSLRQCYSKAHPNWNHVEMLSQSLSSLTQLETLTIHVHTYNDIPLPQYLNYLNIYYEALLPSELRKLVETLSACTLTVDSRLEFGCAEFITYDERNNIMKDIHPISLEKYIAIQQELETLKNIAVKRFEYMTGDVKPIGLTLPHLPGLYMALVVLMTIMITLKMFHIEHLLAVWMIKSSIEFHCDF